MANIKYDLNELAEDLANRLTESVGQETLEQFFFEQHVEWFRDHVTDVAELENEAKALGLISEDDTLELI